MPPHGEVSVAPRTQRAQWGHWMTTIINFIAMMLALVLAGHYAQSIQAAEFDGMFLQSCLEQRDDCCA